MRAIRSEAKDRLTHASRGGEPSGLTRSGNPIVHSAQDGLAVSAHLSFTRQRVRRLPAASSRGA